MIVLHKLKDFRVAILVANGFEESEMLDPKVALEEVGAITTIISPEKMTVSSWVNGNWSTLYPVDLHLDEANPSDYDALLLPGGVINPDRLRLHPKAINFIANIGNAGKPIAAICHGPWTLINANLVKGKTVTSWASIRIDLENAGAIWIDKDAVRDENIVTSRQPADIPVFNEAMLSLFQDHYSKK